MLLTGCSWRLHCACQHMKSIWHRHFLLCCELKHEPYSWKHPEMSDKLVSGNHQAHVLSSQHLLEALQSRQMVGGPLTVNASNHVNTCGPTILTVPQALTLL